MDSTEHFLQRDSLSENEKQVILDWENGRDLFQLVSHPAWQLVLQMFEDYKKSAATELLRITPANPDEVRAQHAVAHGVCIAFDTLAEDIEKAIGLFKSKSLKEVISEAEPTGIYDPFA